MGVAEELKAMAERRELEAVEPSPDRATQLLRAAAHTLKTSRAIVGHDPKSALLLALDGVAFPALSAALALAGYRVTNQMGHHRASVDAGKLLLSDDSLLILPAPSSTRA